MLKGEQMEKEFTYGNWGWEGQKDAPSLQTVTYINCCTKFLRVSKLNSWQRSLGKYKMYSMVTIIMLYCIFEIC